MSLDRIETLTTTVKGLAEIKIIFKQDMARIFVKLTEKFILKYLRASQNLKIS